MNHQFICDQYAKIELERLNYIIFNQKNLRVSNYSGLTDAGLDGESQGIPMVLPSSFAGGPRHMMQCFQDSMAIVRDKGRPDIFTTFTCNPHAHILIILAPEDKIKTIEDVDALVSAEIPDPVLFPHLHETIKTCMMHGPCGNDFPDAVCMVEGKCSKGFPKEFSDVTKLQTTYFETKEQWHIH